MKKIIIIIAVVALCLAPAFSQTSITGGVKIPSQTGQSGKYLKTNGTTLNWSAVTAGLSGSLTANYIPYAVGSGSLANSIIYQGGNNIGIDMSNPSLKLELKSSTNGDFEGQRIYANNMSQNIKLGWGGVQSTSYLKLESGASQDILLNAGRNVGIGTSNPINKFQVDGQTIGFNFNLDGTSTGIPNITYNNTSGGLLTSVFYTGSTGFLNKYYKDGVVTSRVSEVGGYYSNFVNARYDVANLVDNKIKLSTHMVNGYTAIGQDYFVPDAQLDIRGTGIIAQFSDLSVTGCIASLSNKLMVGSTSDHDVSILRNGSERIIVKVNTINIVSLPTSSVGLSSGDIYSNLGVLMIVP